MMKLVSKDFWDSGLAAAAAGAGVADEWESSFLAVGGTGVKAFQLKFRGRGQEVVGANGHLRRQ